MVEISLDFQRFERDLWRGIGRKHITFWKVDGVASVVVPASSWPTVSDMQKRWVLPGKKPHQHADLIQHGIQNNNQTSKVIRFSKTSGFVCKPRVFEQTLEKLRFWICKVYIYMDIKWYTWIYMEYNDITYSMYTLLIKWGCTPSKESNIVLVWCDSSPYHTLIFFVPGSSRNLCRRRW